MSRGIDHEHRNRLDKAKRVPEGTPALAPVMLARHGGTCPECKGQYRPGDTITRKWTGWGHLDCADAFLGGV